MITLRAIAAWIRGFFMNFWGLVVALVALVFICGIFWRPWAVETTKEKEKIVTTTTTTTLPDQHDQAGAAPVKVEKTTTVKTVEPVKEPLLVAVNSLPDIPHDELLARTQAEVTALAQKNGELKAEVEALRAKNASLEQQHSMDADSIGKLRSGLEQVYQTALTANKR